MHLEGASLAVGAVFNAETGAQRVIMPGRIQACAILTRFLCAKINCCSYCVCFRLQFPSSVSLLYMKQKMLQMLSY